MLKEVTHGWINGKSFNELLKIIHKSKSIWGSRRREFKIEDVVEVCETGLAYDGALLIGAICEFIKVLCGNSDANFINQLEIFQKHIQYGLPTKTVITLYELGFSDRVISQDIAISLNLIGVQKKELIKGLKKNRDRAIDILDRYPVYFQERLNELLLE